MFDSEVLETLKEIQLCLAAHDDDALSTNLADLVVAACSIAESIDRLTMAVSEAK